MSPPPPGLAEAEGHWCSTHTTLSRFTSTRVFEDPPSTGMATLPFSFMLVPPSSWFSGCSPSDWRLKIPLAPVPENTDQGCQQPQSDSRSSPRDAGT